MDSWTRESCPMKKDFPHIINSLLENTGVAVQSFLLSELPWESNSPYGELMYLSDLLWK